MGDSFSLRSPAGARPFSADQLFDPQSPYGRMRGSLKPEAKLRGFFHYLAVQQKAKRAEGGPLAFAAKTGKAPTANLVVSTAAPEQPLDADLWLDLVPFGGRGRLLLSFRIRDRKAAPPAGTVCRAFFLTAGMLERLAGAEATRSSDAARKAVSGVLSGRSVLESFEAARVLAAVPEMDGEIDEEGFCKFDPFDLPEQAGHVDELPPKSVVVVVVDRRQS
jgi:hypothetical protein